MDWFLDKAAVRRTVDFYLARTSHGSALSRPVCSWLLARADRKLSWSSFTEALDSYLSPTFNAERPARGSISAPWRGSIWILRCYTGLETRDDVLRLHPILPPELGRVQFQLTFRGRGILMKLPPSSLTLRLQTRAAPPIRVHVDDPRSQCTLGTHTV